MKSLRLLISLLLFGGVVVGQPLHLSTLIPNIDASGGLAIDPSGNIYVSDFGKSFNDTSLTKVFKVENGTWDVSVFADGFSGASGSSFSGDGTFYQSNPKGKRVSKVSKSGQVLLDYSTSSLYQTPVGLAENSKGELFVCNCVAGNILKIGKDGQPEVFSEGSFFSCPNGMTIIPGDTLVVVNFGNDKVIKIDPLGNPTVLADGFPLLTGGPNPVGLGHITYSNGNLFATGIGRGYIFRISLSGEFEIIAGDGQFKNTDGPALSASLSKPNGIIASQTGDTLYVNVTDPSWAQDPQALHPAHLKILTGVCSLPGSNCK